MTDSTDRGYYDRQKRVLGKKAMERMQKSVVVICGLSGLGMEISKNVILTGVKAVFLCDEGKVSWNDLSSSFYFTEHDIGSNRVDSCIGQLKELNSFVKVERLNGKITKEFLEKEKVSVVIYTDSPVVSLTEENDLCRSVGARFIAAETRGLFGSVFCDMGDEFEVFDDNGEPPSECTITDITNEENAMVTVLDDNINHGLGIGDKVIFSHVGGMEELNTMGPVDIDLGKGTGKHYFRIKVDTRNMKEYARGTGYLKQVKPAKKMKFLKLSEAIENAPIENYDFGKWDWGKLYIHPLFRAVNDFIQKFGDAPKSGDEGDFKKLQELAAVYLPKKEKMEDEEGAEKKEKTPKELEEEEKKRKMIEDIIKIFSFGYRGNLNPMAALIGGFAAQEVQKAVSGKFTPLNQWFYFDAIECLDRNDLPKDSQPTQTRYDGQIAVFGKAFQEKIQKSKIFVVGAGALGCEYLKNFSLIGVGTKKEEGGKVIVTDMDSIEVSNLNRQFLFRNRHVGKMKSICASEAVKNMNSAVNIDPLTDKVAPETEEVFNDRFWTQLDCVVNALDNIIARLYVDGKCVYYRKPLIEAGTLGPKANTQIVIPGITESYGSQRDPPEKEFPQCTIKNFPYKVEHCISWARELFEGYFTNEPKNVNAYLKNPNFLQELRESENSTSCAETLEKIYTNLVTEKPTSFEDCVQWARSKFEKHFANDIKQLLYNFPKDHITKTGMKFWSGAKRPPTPLDFSLVKEWEKEFVIAAANIRANIFGLKGGRDFDFDSILKKVNVPEFVPKSVKIQVEEEEEDGENANRHDVDEDENKIESLLKKLPNPSTMPGFELNVETFEKDDDTNYHIDFITAASNNRASNYNIPQSDRYKTKGIAGRIIPAMVTSTALITGFGCLEFLKIVQGKDKIEDFRNAYVNLALPSCTQSEPIPPKKSKYYDIEFTEWDKFEVNLGRDVTLKEFIEYFRQKHKLVVTTVNFGKAMVYAAFMSDDEEENRKLGELCFEVAQSKPKKGQEIINLVILADGLDDEEFDVPDVKYRFTGF